MPNWCITSYIFTGNDVELEDFYNKLEQAQNTLLVESDFRCCWLGNVLATFGIDPNECEGKFRFRGSIVYLDKYEEECSMVEVLTDTAWCPMSKIWDEIIEKYYPSLSYVFLAEEPGIGLFVNTDSTRDIFNYDYCVSLNLPNVSYYSEYLNKHEILDVMKIETGMRFKSVKQMKIKMRKYVKKCNKKAGDNIYYFEINKFDDTYDEGE